MSELFNRDTSVIGKHLKNIYNSKELGRNSTMAKSAIVQIEGKREITRHIEYYNLDAILSVGYRVNSKQGDLPPKKWTLFWGKIIPYY